MPIFVLMACHFILKPFPVLSIRKLFSILLLAMLGIGSASAQTPQSYFVFLNRKAPAETSFLQSFHPKAIERRIKLGLSFPDYQDLPFHASDLSKIAQNVDSVRHALRWMGAVSVNATAEQVKKLLQFPFIDHVEAMGCFDVNIASIETDLPAPDTSRQRKLYGMVRGMMQLDTLQQIGLSGKGVRIAIFDAGFTDADMHPAFERIRQEGRLALTNDFYGGKGTDVYYGSKHGTAVWGCIGGISPLGWIGAAPDATFLLARTEHNRQEKPIEEDHWMAAAEWADQNGVDIISSSLGYAKKRYDPSQMDGKTSLVSRAAAIAVRKGILVVNSAGNEGQSAFRTIATPGDADSVLTVGASYPMVRYVMPFSSCGPNSRGILKPEISAPGYVLTAGTKDKWVEMPGTSFACPLVAGVAACLMQAEPDLSNMQVKERIVQAGHFHPYFDAALGHGVLDARLLFRPNQNAAPNFRLFYSNDSLFVIPSDSVLALKTASSSNGKPLHVSNLNAEGRLLAYTQRRLGPADKKVPIPDPVNGTATLRIWWEGYLFEAKK